MASKTTTTTTIYSRKDSDGNWQEYDKSVTTVVERDDEGYPYGPIPVTPPYLTASKRTFGGPLSEYINDYYNRQYFSSRTWSEDEKEDGQDG